MITLARMKRVVRPETLSGAELDQYLADGWYRIGQTMMTCSAILINGALRSTVWTRVPTMEFEFRKSLRRLRSKNRRRFRVEFRDAGIDDEREEVYQRYIASVDGHRAPDLYAFRFGDRPEVELFETKEVAFFEGDELVGFSWFDVGDDSVQSLLGAFDPRVSKHSVGFHSMLEEIAFARETGRSFFYSGYVLPGDASMDYKLRTGHVYFMDDRSGAWRPWEHFPHYTPPVERMAQHLRIARMSIDARAIPSAIVFNPMFDIASFFPELSDCLQLPLALECNPDSMSSARFVVTYNLDNACYELSRCERIKVALPRSEGGTTALELMAVRETLSSHHTAHDLAATLANRAA